MTCSSQEVNNATHYESCHFLKTVAFFFVLDRCLVDFDWEKPGSTLAMTGNFSYSLFFTSKNVRTD